MLGASAGCKSSPKAVGHGELLRSGHRGHESILPELISCCGRVAAMELHIQHCSAILPWAVSSAAFEPFPGLTASQGHRSEAAAVLGHPRDAPAL